MLVGPCSLSCIRTRPSEGTDAHAAYRHYPYTANHILLLVNVLGIGSLAVEHTNLIVQQVSAVGILEEITLELQTDVTTIGSVLSGTVAETCQLAHVLGITHEALVDRVHRILKGERILELTDLHLEVFILLPFSKQIHHSRTGTEGRGVAVELNLSLPVEVASDATFESDTSHTDVE